MNVRQVSVEALIPYARNARTHADDQVAKIAGSIQEFGFTNPILVDGKNGIIAGHGRLAAAKKLGLKEVPVIELAHLTPAQKKAYILADNRLALDAGWDNEMLSAELLELKDEGFDLSKTGFSQEELNALLAEEVEALTDEDEVPEVQAEAITKSGDVWILGKHRLMCGDSTSVDAVDKLMDGQKAVLLHADPPYGMGKEKEGVANDNLYADKLDAFQMEWWLACRPFLKENASAYIWGNAEDLWRLWYRGGLANSERLTFRNEILWAKSVAQGISAESHRQFPTSTERCLFFMLGEQGFNNNADNYWEGFEPIRCYLDGERKKAGWTNKTVADFFGFHPRMADHWFSKSQWSFPTEEQYKRLQKEARDHDAFKRDFDELKRDFDELKRDFDELKQAFYATRAYFDNTHDNMTDVWEFQRVVGDERHGHATPKPVEMICRAIKSSSPSDAVVLEPFLGSGTTLIAAEQVGRKCFGMEISPQYCDVIIRRWQAFTGKQATHENGKTFEELANAHA